MPSQKFKIFLIVILVLNLLALNVFMVFVWRQIQTIKNSPTVNNKDQCSITCPAQVCDCQLPTVVPVEPTKTTTITTKAKIKTTSYIPVSGSGSTLENKWVDLSGTEFYLNTQDYPNLKEAYFEANMKLLNGNGLAFLRLFDVTDNIEVWGSDVQTGSQNFTSVTSSKLTLRPGNHLYRVQAKSLTADTTIFNSGRIKLISEN